MEAGCVLLFKTCTQAGEKVKQHKAPSPPPSLLACKETTARTLTASSGSDVKQGISRTGVEMRFSSIGTPRVNRMLTGIAACMSFAHRESVCARIRV